MDYFQIFWLFIALNIILYPVYLGWRQFVTKRNPQVIQIGNKYYVRIYEFGLGWRLVDNNAQSTWGYPDYPADSIWRWCMHYTAEEAFECAEKFANRQKKPVKIKKPQVIKNDKSLDKQ